MRLPRKGLTVPGLVICWMSMCQRKVGAGWGRAETSSTSHSQCQLSHIFIFSSWQFICGSISSSARLLMYRWASVLVYCPLSLLLFSAFLLHCLHPEMQSEAIDTSMLLLFTEGSVIIEELCCGISILKWGVARAFPSNYLAPPNCLNMQISSKLFLNGFYRVPLSNSQRNTNKRKLSR